MADEKNSQMDNRVKSLSTKIENSEIESLQEDIGSLIENINKFISGQPKHITRGTELYEYTNNGNTSEKDDGPPEKNKSKEHRLNHPCPVAMGDVLSDSDSESDMEPEIDWSVAGPVLQKHISDLERLHSLNVATSSLIRRLKKLTDLKHKKSMKLATNEEKLDAHQF